MQQVSETSSVLVSVEFFANYIGKTPKAIRQMVAAGKLPVIRLKNPQNLDGEGEILIHRGEWDEYANQLARIATPEWHAWKDRLVTTRPPAKAKRKVTGANTSTVKADKKISGQRGLAS
ncbi:Cox family DNA-binding protein [Yersinia pekkanenii]|uniref:Bacteriophage regulatory protein n=1 Tax=Yersinia pekkanenii TaxID=1288385 RepID=A0ABP2A279_9GAMM|nr:Cox family DNA-binding protein [Yersinia pekkanenii]CRY69156.1 bacteriophage regulatory protein [Yersinia pekkanenii]